MLELLELELLELELLELLDALPPELAAELTLKLTPLPPGCTAMPPSMGANPRAIVISQRAKSIVLSVLSVCAEQPTRTATAGR